MKLDAVRALARLAALVTAVACSAADSTNTEPPPPTPDRLTVALNVDADSLLLGTTRLFSATVTNQFNEARAAQVLWSVTNTTVLTVDRSGLVTAVGEGSAQVIAAIQGHADTAMVSVYGAPISLQVVPSVLSLAVGDDYQVVADVGDAAAGAGMPVRWEVSDTTVARISTDGVITGLQAGDVVVTAQVGTAKAGAEVGVFPRPVASVTVTPSSATVLTGDSVVLSAVARAENNKVISNKVATWASSNPAIATVQGGVVRGVSRGFATITATIDGKIGSATINVTPSAVATVTLTLPDSSLSVGQKAQASAVARDANGAIVPGLTIGWQSSNPAVATINSSGMVSALVAGNTNISAIIGGQVGTVALSVATPVATSLAILPSNPSLTVGGTAQLAGEVRDQNGQKMTGQAVTWSSANPSAATISSSGLLTGVAAGTSTIQAAAGSLNASTTATVNPIAVASISISPSSAQLSVDDSVRLAATTRDAQGNVLGGRVVTWSSSNVTIASVDAAGYVLGIAAGSATITATSEGKSATASVTVSAPAPPALASISVTLNSAALDVGQSTQATAIARDNAGNTVSGITFTWSSSNAAVATVNNAGMVTAMGAGSVSIMASAGGTQGGASLTVNSSGPAPVATVTLTLSPSAVGAGQAASALAVLQDSAGNVLTGRTIGYSTGNPSVATVSSGGKATGVAAGEARITATSEGKSGKAILTVTSGAPVVASVAVSAPVTSLQAGDTTRAVATALDASGNTIGGVTFTWASSDPTVASVGNAGKVTGVAGGSASISATTNGISGSLGFTVSAAPPAPCASATVSLNSGSLTVGQTTQAVVVLKDAAGNVLTGRTVTWSSSNTAAATVSSSGLVTAAGAGSSNISATCGNATGSASVSVTAGAVSVASVSVTLTPNSVSVGQTSVGTAVLKDSAGNVLTGKTITWSVTAGGSVASVSSTGVVSAVATGTATITATSGAVAGSAVLSVSAASPIAMPQLPRSVPSFPASLATRACTDRPATAAALQQALNAGGSRTICLSAGLQIAGYFDIPARASGDTAWSVLRADMPFTLGQRITGQENLPRITITDVRFSALHFHSRAARWFVQGLELTTDPNITAGPMALVEIGERISERSLSDLPKDIHFAHMNLHGWPLQNLRRGWVLNGANLTVRDSRCTEIHERNSDSQCTLSYNGSGPFLIENNTLEAASENIMFGGGDPGITGLVPCDITVRGNLIRKSPTWKSVGTPTQSGSYLIKLLYESKNACRALVENNRMDGSWLDGQTGYAIGLKSVNQSGACTWCRVTDQTFRNNTIVNVGAVFGLAGAPEKYPVDTALSRVHFTGNWIDSVNISPYNGDARGVLLLSRARDISFVRNTWGPAGNWNRDFMIFDITASTAVINFRFDDNVMPIAQYGVGATAVGEGTKALNAAVTGTWTFNNNTFIGAPRNGYPATTQWAATLSAALATGAGITQRPVP